MLLLIFGNRFKQCADDVTKWNWIAIKLTATADVGYIRILWAKAANDFLFFWCDSVWLNQSNLSKTFQIITYIQQVLVQKWSKFFLTNGDSISSIFEVELWPFEVPATWQKKLSKETRISSPTEMFHDSFSERSWIDQSKTQPVICFRPQNCFPYPKLIKYSISHFIRRHYKKSFTSNHNGLAYTFDTVMAKTAAESQDVKNLEKLFKRQLNDIEVDKELLENRLKNKVAEIRQLHVQFRNKEVVFITLNSTEMHFWLLLKF